MIEVLDDAFGDPRHVELNVRLHRDVWVPRQGIKAAAALGVSIVLTGSSVGISQGGRGGTVRWCVHCPSNRRARIPQKAPKEGC